MENPSFPDSLYPADYYSSIPEDTIALDFQSIKEFAEATVSEATVMALRALANVAKSVK
mgnify:CR=1 FL=1